MKSYIVVFNAVTRMTVQAENEDEAIMHVEEYYDNISSLMKDIEGAENIAFGINSVEEKPVPHGIWFCRCSGYMCSQCERTIPIDSLSDYCPHCGAKMDNTQEIRDILNS